MDIDEMIQDLIVHVRSATQHQTNYAIDHTIFKVIDLEYTQG